MDSWQPHERTGGSRYLDRYRVRVSAAALLSRSSPAKRSRFSGIEWQCGYEYREYFKSYPVLLFPPDYIEPGSTESGVYFHWVSVIDPVQRTPMIMQGIQTVHNSEARSLKAALERRAGLTEARTGLYRIEADTIYVNAPIEMGAEFLGDLRTMETWSHLLKPAGDHSARERGTFTDEYGQRVDVTLRTNRLEEYYLVEQDYVHPQHNFTQRSPTFLIPLSYAFGDPGVPGFLLHRITFWKNGVAPRHGKLTIDDFGAENMNIKRLLEAKAGNLETFALGKSYLPQPITGWREISDADDTARYLFARVRRESVSALPDYAR